MSEPENHATIDDLRTLLRRGSAGARTELEVLPISREELAGLIPHLTRAERNRLERLLPRTREEGATGWLDDTVVEQALRRLTDSELAALCALTERMSGHPLRPEDVPDELRPEMPQTGENERWIAAINTMGEKLARDGDSR